MQSMSKYARPDGKSRKRHLPREPFPLVSQHGFHRHGTGSHCAYLMGMGLSDSDSDEHLNHGGALFVPQQQLNISQNSSDESDFDSTSDLGLCKRTGREAINHKPPEVHLNQPVAVSFLHFLFIDEVAN